MIDEILIGTQGGEICRQVRHVLFAEIFGVHRHSSAYIGIISSSSTRSPDLKALSCSIR